MAEKIENRRVSRATPPEYQYKHYPRNYRYKIQVIPKILLLPTCLSQFNVILR